MNDSLGDRMKAYEKAFNFKLTPRTPVIIRVDGKAFHTYTRKLNSHDANFDFVMNLTAMKLCSEIQGAQLAYIQSDEISVLVHNYKKFNTQPWFGNEIQKMVSVSAAIASANFSINSNIIWESDTSGIHYWNNRPAYFDSRVFILPEKEVVNYFIWRQNDCVRNSVQSHARSLFSHKEMFKKNCDLLKEMCEKKNLPWENIPLENKMGRCAIPSENISPKQTLTYTSSWSVVPAWDFKLERDKVESFLQVEEG